MREGTF